jgi:thymidylate synthase
MTDRLPEHQYLDLLRSIRDQGDLRIDRTGTGTLANFGTQLRFDLSDGSFPMMTTKKVFWKLAVKEMLWFLTGGTNIRELLQQNVRIWSDWPLANYRKVTGEAISQEAFEAKVLESEEFAHQWGDLGPVYGKQWRRWLGPDGKEHDQIGSVLKALKTSPASRRILFHGWNVADLDKMALPPCHLLYQYFVSDLPIENVDQLSADKQETINKYRPNHGEKKRPKLNSVLYQRSCDSTLGLCFNLTSQAALMAILAQQADLELGELIWFGGDTHLYLDHLEGVETQLARKPFPFPKLKLLRKPDSIDGYRIEDFEVTGYQSHPHIEFPVAV